MASEPRAVTRAWLWGTAGLTVGTVAVVAAFAPPAAAPPGQALSWLLFTGSSVHVAATGWLLSVRDVRAQAGRHRIRYLAVPAALTGMAALLAALLPPAAFRWLLLPYFGWQFFHFQKQNLGLAALARTACRLPPLSPGQRRALLLTGGAGIAGLLTRPGLLGLPLDVHLARLSPVIAAGFGAAVLAGLVAAARRPASARSPVSTAMYLTGLLFPAPVFLFGSPYAAAGGMTAAHGLQYLLLVGLFAAGPGSRPAKLLRLALLANIALAGGAALSAASHLHGAGPAGRLLFGLYLGAVMAHFVIDAGLWRMRDPAARQRLADHLPSLVPGRRHSTGAPVSVSIPAADRSAAGVGSRS